jgi:hypothetical protein
MAASAQEISNGLVSVRAASGSGLELGAADTMRVTLRPGGPYPAVASDLTVAGFDSAQWTNRVGLEPFHFLALHLAQAEAWHQRGWGWHNESPTAAPAPHPGAHQGVCRR